MHLNRYFTGFKSIPGINLVGQFLSLSSIQMANSLIPLVVIPYVSRILGPDTLGLVNFGTSFLTYFTLVINFGFDYSATREISVNSNNLEKLHKIISLTLISKLLLFIVASIGYLLIILTVDRYSKELEFYLFSLIFLFGNVFYSTWLFQGLQKLYVFTIINFAARILSVFAVFYFVKVKSDYVVYQIILSVTFFVTAIVSLFIAFTKFNLSLVSCKFNEVLDKLKRCFTLFLSVVIVNFNTTSTVVILGYMTTYTIVGYYSSAIKVYAIISSLSLIPLSQVFYPHLAKKFAISVEEGIKFLKASFLKILSFFVVIVIIVVVAARYIVLTVFGPGFEQSADLLRMIMPLLIISTIVNMLCYQVMLNLKMDRAFFKINVGAFILNIAVSFILIPRYGAFGTCTSLYIVELFIILLSVITLRKNGILIFKK